MSFLAHSSYSVDAASVLEFGPSHLRDLLIVLVLRLLTSISFQPDQILHDDSQTNDQLIGRRRKSRSLLLRSGPARDLAGHGGLLFTLLIDQLRM